MQNLALVVPQQTIKLVKVTSAGAVEITPNNYIEGDESRAVALFWSDNHQRWFSSPDAWRNDRMEILGRWAAQWDI